MPDDYEKAWNAAPAAPSAGKPYAKAWGDEEEPADGISAVRAATFGATPKADFAETDLSEDEKAAYMKRLYPGEDVDPGSEVLDPEEQRRIFEETKAKNLGVMGFPRRDWEPGVEDILLKRTSAAAFDKVFGRRRRADLPEIEEIVAKHEPKAPEVSAGERAAYTAERFPSAMMGPAAGLGRMLNEKLAGGDADLRRRMDEATEAAADPTVARLGSRRAAEIRADVEGRPGWAFAAHATELAGAVPTFVGGGKALANPLTGFGRVVAPAAVAPTLMGLHGLETSGGDVAAAGQGVLFGGLATGISARLGAWLDALPVLKRTEAIRRLTAGFGKEGPAFAAADAILNGVDGSRMLEQYVFGSTFGLAGGHGDPKRRALEAQIVERARAEMRAVVEKATPGATPEARDAYLNGDPSKLTPEQTAAANVATAPIHEGFRQTIEEAAKAAEGATPRGPQETLSATLAGPEALAKAKEKTYDATVIPPETVAAAEAAAKAEPATPERMVKVYRGEAPEGVPGQKWLQSIDKDRRGRWFTTDRKVAGDYAGDAGRIIEAEVPESVWRQAQIEAGRGRVGGVGEEGAGVLPVEWVPASKPTEAPARPAEPASLPAAPTPTEAPAPRATPKVEAGRLVEKVRVADLDIDPKTFQIKGGVDSLTGVTKKLEGTAAWDPAAGGVLTVWERADGKRFVVDGHHRYQIAKEKGVDEIPAVVLRESEGISSGEARVAGALSNIRSGTIDALDAAVVVKEAGYTAADLVKMGVPPKSAALRDSVGLAGLADDVLSQVRNGELSREAGAEIGRQLPGDENVFKQRQAAKEIRGMERPTADEVASLVRQVRTAPDVEVRQENLFGTEVGAESLRPQVAKVEAALMARLRKDKALHTTLAGKASQAEKVEGTKINVEGSKSEAQKAAEALDLIQRSMDKGGAVSKIVEDAARRLKDGASVQDVVGEAAERIRTVDFYRDEFTTPQEAAGAEPGGAGADAGGLFGDRPGVPREGAQVEPVPGDTVTGRTREGLTVTGTFERATDKSLVVTTPEGKTARIEKAAVEAVEKGEGAPPEVMGRPIERDASRTDEGARTGDPILADVPQARSVRSAQDFPVAPQPGIDPGRPVGVHEVIKALEKFAGKKLFIGRLKSRKAAGEYYPIPDYARIRDSNDPMSGAHELFHSIDKHVLPWAQSAPAWKTMKAELLAIGHRLYPGRRPAGGWLKEGFAEYGADWMHNEAAARTQAPEFTRWWESEFLAQNKEFRKNADEAARIARRYAGQGGVARVQGDIRRGKTEDEWWDANEARRRWIDSNDPINRATATAEAAKGTLPVSKSPAKIAELRQGKAAAIVDRWIESGQTDIHGNRVGDSLRQIFSREGIRGQSDDFVAYAMARQGLVDIAAGKKTTNSAKDYQAVVDKFRNPAFDRGVTDLIRYHKNLLDYLESSGAIDADTRARIDEHVYIAPSERIIDKKSRRFVDQGGSGALARKHGSTLQTRDIRESIISRTEGALRLAHESQVQETLVQLAPVEGMGEYIRKVPKDKMVTKVPVEAARKSLEDMGVDVDGLGISGETIEAWGVRPAPNGKDLIIRSRRTGDWYEVNKDIYEAINGIDARALANPLVKWLWHVPATIGRVMNTSARPAFVLLNSARDAVMAYVNGSVHNPAKFARNYFRELYGEASDKIARAFGRDKETPVGEAVRNLGMEHATRFFQEAPATIRKAQTLGTTAMERLRTHPFRTLARWSRNAFEWYRTVINATEIVPRRAEARATLERSGWKPGDPLTMDLLQGVLEAMNVTANFPKMGSAVRAYNTGVPFFGAAFTGPAATVRALKMRPLATTLKALGTLTASALATWFAFKDEDWWKRLPHEQKWSYLRIPMGDQIFQIPLQGDQQFFSIPVAALDAAYQRDPEGALAVAKAMVMGMAPNVLPPLASEALAQVGNKDLHFGTPIESGAVKGLPTTERVNRRTTGLARAISNALSTFGVDFSPVRADHAIRGVFGGAASDFAGLVTGHEAEPRMSFDAERPERLPGVGRLFQMGGRFGTPNRHVESVFDKAREAGERGRSLEKPEGPAQAFERRRLENAASVLSLLSRARLKARSLGVERKLSEYLNKIADKADAGGDAPPEAEIRELVEGLGLVKPRR